LTETKALTPAYAGSTHFATRDESWANVFNKRTAKRSKPKVCTCPAILPVDILYLYPGVNAEGGIESYTGEACYMAMQYLLTRFGWWDSKDQLQWWFL